MKKVGLHVSLETPTALLLPKKTMEKEIWRPIKGYEGLYEVSNLGRIRSLDRITNYANGEKHLWKGRIMKPAKNKNGYLICDLHKNSKRKTFNVHRLVAQAFIKNPDNLPVINHKDEDKTNNCVDNLEWCTYSYNNSYGEAFQSMKRKLSKTVLQIDIETNQIIAEYTSLTEAARQTNFSKGDISNCCTGRYNKHKGFKWKYKE